MSNTNNINNTSLFKHPNMIIQEPEGDYETLYVKVGDKIYDMGPTTVKHEMELTANKTVYTGAVAVYQSGSYSDTYITILLEKGRLISIVKKMNSQVTEMCEVDGYLLVPVWPCGINPITYFIRYVLSPLVLILKGWTFGKNPPRNVTDNPLIW